jgi:tight adherence protein B
MDLMPILTMALGALVVLGMIAFAFSGPSAKKAVDRRMTVLKDRHAETVAGAVEAQMRRAIASRATKMDGYANRLLPNPAQIRKRLSQTGKTWTMGQYMIASGSIVVVIAGLLMLKGMPFLLALLVGIIAGAGLPHMVVNFHIKRRIKMFNAKFPDAIELLVRGLRSGLPVTETMSVVAQEVPGPVGVEFRSVVDKMKIGRAMEIALQDTADRLGTPEFQFFCITLAIQRETGGNLAETLSNLADVLRKRGQMKLKIRAMSSESKASAYIIGALPFIVFGLIWMINGGYMQKFFTDERLMVAGGGGLVWMSIGAFIMAKMIDFEI